MAYIALSRKWRPQRFSEVVGQQHVVRTLRNEIASERVHHAYLFSGPRGVGKTTMARIFARALNCKARLENSDPCGECDSCVSIRQGNSLDVVEIDAASNNGVDDIRELRENVKLTAVASRYRVYILDEAHMLSTAAWNAFLTTLEEPPPHVIFIFASTEKNKFPATILSRCQQFDFYRMTYEEVASRLRELTAGEGRDVDEEALGLITHQSEGCLRDAQSFLEQLLSFCPEGATAEDASRMLGFGSAAAVDGMTRALAEGDALAAFRAAETLFSQGADVTQCLRLIGAHFHALLRLRVSPELAGTIQASPSAIEQMREQAETLPLSRIQWILKILMRAERDIRILGYDRENFELAALDICRLEEDVPLEEALSRLEALEERVSSSPPAYAASSVPSITSVSESSDAPRGSSLSSSPESSQDSSTPSSPGSSVSEEGGGSSAASEPPGALELSEENASDVWRAALGLIADENPPLNGCLSGSRAQYQDGSLQVSLESRVRLNRANEEREAIAKAVSSVAGRPVEVRLTIEADALRGRSEIFPEDEEAEKEKRGERRVLNLFDGRIALSDEELSDEERNRDE